MLWMAKATIMDTVVPLMPVEFQNTSVSTSINVKLAVCTSTEIILSSVKNFFWV